MIIWSEFLENLKDFYSTYFMLSELVTPNFEMLGFLVLVSKTSSTWLCPYFRICFIERSHLGFFLDTRALKIPTLIYDLKYN